jgi:hypothetical protein
MRISLEYYFSPLQTRAYHFLESRIGDEFARSIALIANESALAAIVGARGRLKEFVYLFADAPQEKLFEYLAEYRPQQGLPDFLRSIRQKK